MIPLSETSVRLTWDLPAKNLRNGEIIMYQVNFHKQSDSINVEDLNVTDNTMDISGLDMNTDYVFLIRGYTSKGPGPWSNKQIAHTFGHSKYLFEILEILYDYRMVLCKINMIL